MKKIIYLLILTLSVSCFDKNISKLNHSSDISLLDLDNDGLKINQELLSNIKNDIKIEPVKLNREVWNYDKDGNEQHYFLNKGIVFKFVNEQKAHSVFNKYFNEVVKGDNYIFLTNMDFDESYNTFYDIVIIDGSDPFKLIEQIGTNGVNYDIYNQDIINKLKEWNEKVNFKFVVIDVSRIHAYMDNLPENIVKFTSEVYEFCPDVIDQGYSSMDEMISDYKESKYFWLWWD